MAPPASPAAAPARGRFEEAYAFDDVLLVPAYSTVLPADTDTRTFHVGLEPAGTATAAPAAQLRTQMNFLP